ncbi:MAG: CapA family protein [Sciscionella sp.]
MRNARLVPVVLLAVLLVGCSGIPGGSSAPPAGNNPAASSSAAPSSAAPSSAPDTAGFSVIASGDFLIHPAVTAQAVKDGHGRIGYDPIMAGVRPEVSAADLAICHLETPVATKGGPYQGYPQFDVPPQIISTIKWMGYDSCSTASNHSLDQGAAGITRTLDDLDAAGVKHTGSARSAAGAARVDMLDVHGIKVAQFSYAYGFNGFTVPKDKPWLANRIDVTTILQAARAAKKAGAKVVILSLHWGIEDHHAATAKQRRMAKKLLDDPAVDLIIGCHAHVVQPFEKINGKWVVYGMGNLVARHDDPLGTTEEGVLARFHFARNDSGGYTVDKAQYIPTLIELTPKIRVLDLTGPSADQAPAARRKLALRRTDHTVLSMGAGAAGLTRG